MGRPRCWSIEAILSSLPLWLLDGGLEERCTAHLVSDRATLAALHTLRLGHDVRFLEQACFTAHHLLTYEKRSNFSSYSSASCIGVAL